MQKRKYVFIALSLGFLVISLAATYFYSSYMKYQERLVARHQLLCEVLKPGMSEDEVLRILRQAGEFTTNRGEWAGGRVEIGINFTDINGIDPYGRPFELGFFNGKYTRAYVNGFDYYFEPICDFDHQPTQSAAAPT